MNVIPCPRCSVRVVPKADGRCPSCQAQIASLPPGAGETAVAEPRERDLTETEARAQVEIQRLSRLVFRRGAMSFLLLLPLFAMPVMMPWTNDPEPPLLSTSFISIWMDATGLAVCSLFLYVISVSLAIDSLRKYALVKKLYDVNRTGSESMRYAKIGHWLAYPTLAVFFLMVVAVMINKG